MAASSIPQLSECLEWIQLHVLFHESIKRLGGLDEPFKKPEGQCCASGHRFMNDDHFVTLPYPQTLFLAIDQVRSAEDDRRGHFVGFGELAELDIWPTSLESRMSMDADDDAVGFTALDGPRRLPKSLVLLHF